MQYIIICLRALSMLGGGSLIVAQVLQNLEFMGWPSALSGLGLAAIVVPVAMAITVLVMELARDERRYGFAAVALVVLLCGLGHTFIVALERSAHARDQVAAATAGKNAPYQLAQKAWNDANARVTRLEGELREARRTGCGPVCKSLQADVAVAQTVAADKQRRLAELGVPVEVESMAKRYGTLATDIDHWHPVLQPLAIEAGALVLIGMAFPRKRRAQASAVAVPVASPTKVEEAIAALKELQEQRGSLPSVRETAKILQLPPTTIHRAKQRMMG